MSSLPEMKYEGLRVLFSKKISHFRLCSPKQYFSLMKKVQVNNYDGCFVRFNFIATADNLLLRINRFKRRYSFLKIII